MKTFLTYLTVILSQQVYAQNSSLVDFLASQQMIKSGRAIFQQDCAGCHGTDAQGEGIAAPMLNPKPRNLVTGAYKFRSTPLGSLPSDADLLRTIEQGVLGASMPGFPSYTSQQKFALVQYLKSLRPDWNKNAGTPFVIPLPDAVVLSNRTLFLASAYRGRKLFVDACLTCHGDKGRGDGPSAQGLMDGEGRAIRPANLSSDRIKSGRRAQDVYKAILTGLDGTPMPSFDGIYTEQQIWELVNYVLFLRGQANGIYPESLTLTDDTLKAESLFKKAKTSDEPSTATSGENWN